MSEVSYSNVPPMMAAIKSGDIEAIRSLLHAGHSPNEPQCYQVMIGDWPRDDEASPLELAVLENRMDMVQLLIECGADLTHNPEELLSVIHNFDWANPVQQYETTETNQLPKLLTEAVRLVEKESQSAGAN